jgi:hypothetical protein
VQIVFGAMMIHPKFWLKHMRARRAIKGYPLYDVPHKQAEAELPESQAQENFDYFMKVRLDRLAFFQKWLLDNFGVKASLDGDGVRAVGQWVDDYSGGLIGDEPHAMGIFADYQPRWEEEYAGYNVMIDIGIFLGEYLISKRPRLHWSIYQGQQGEPGSFGAPWYRRPNIQGFPTGLIHDALTTGYWSVERSRDASKVGGYPDYPRSSRLVVSAKAALYKTKVPESGPFMYGDSSNEPL